MKDPILEVFLAFTGIAIAVLNASLWLAWISIKNHTRWLQEQSRRMGQVETSLARINRRNAGISEEQWERFQQHVADGLENER